MLGTMPLAQAATLSDAVIYSATVSWYSSGGPFSWCRSIKDWFNDNVVPPPLETPEDVHRFFRQLSGML
jgi:hypothetical protein